MTTCAIGNVFLSGHMKIVFVKPVVRWNFLILWYTFNIWFTMNIIVQRLDCRAGARLIVKTNVLKNENNFIIINARDKTYISLEQIRKYIIIISMYFFWKSLYFSNFNFLFVDSYLSYAFNKYLRSTQTYNIQYLHNG